jgi:hypothetical protein
MAKVPVFARLWESGSRIGCARNENRLQYGSGGRDGIH